MSCGVIAWLVASGSLDTTIEPEETITPIMYRLDRKRREPRVMIDIRFPKLGVVRRFGLYSAENRSEHYSPYAMNARLEDSLTSRLRGGSFTAQAPSSVDVRFVVLKEDGDGILLEDGDEVAGETDDRIYVEIETENGTYTVTTENGDTIVLGPQYSAATDYGREWVAGGSGAPNADVADCIYRDRLIRVDNNVIFASRQGDMTEWDFGKDVEDEGRATAFQLSVADEVGDDVTALAPHRDSHLFCFTATETWVLSGDPTSGSLRNVSRDVGCIASRAWCKAGDTLYFLSSHGLYSVRADGSGLKPVSEDRVPTELSDIDDDDCVLDYYHADRGIYMHMTESPSWFYDIGRDAFWPFDLDSSQSHVLLGPIQVGDINSYGRIVRFFGVIATGSASVSWAWVLGDTAEEAATNGKAAIIASLAGSDYSGYLHSSGSWSAGINTSVYPRGRAQWVVLWLSSTGTWAFERAAADTATSGKWR